MRVKVWARKGSSFEEEAAADREYWETLFTPNERVALIRDLRDEWERINGRQPMANRDYFDFLTALLRHDVRFLIVGSHAVAFHLKPRYTKDIDIFIDSAPANVAGVLRAIDDFGFGSLGFKPEDLRVGQWIQLGVAPYRIDVTTSIAGVTFEEAWDSRAEGDFEGIPVHYIGREDLIRNKAAVGRPQDLADVAALR